jgi:hypothetical protein
LNNWKKIAIDSTGIILKMKEDKSEKNCSSHGSEGFKRIPFTDGKNIKWVLACRKCEAIIDERVIESFYEPYKN